MTGQLGFAEGWVSPKLGRNESLDRLSQDVRWYRFEKLLVRLDQGGGRPPFPPLLMLKALLLQQFYGLSDADLEEAINDRVSFRRFIGLPLEASSPDHTTLCRFRNRLAEAGLSEKLFGAFSRQLEARGLVLKRGTMIDASLVATPFRPGSSSGTREAVDDDATLTMRKHRAHYGYKVHIGTDQDSRLIRRLVLTGANVADTDMAERLVCGDEQAVYADKAYAKRARRQWLKAAGIKPRIMHKTWGGGPPLTPLQRRHNDLISPIRAQVEGVFATLKRWMGFTAVRYNGLKANRSHCFLLALAYNMKRSLKLA
ncbi:MULTISPECIES: IS5 family transposase [unclassified Sphingobium]|uniref:IS5 family transposase n=1 Tax=unclassified Sphingobium TaxID=2611147 RepID=UPI002224C976|nr:MULTISPECIES: IS5 family transposase [unclassified Sphingobium]MCW2410342.1 IS5 family transposase [Sphingobium sp. B8D3D]MCW2411037.1 IS5 family transposase [Sphingobium sp. B8D3D]MCW2411159.1 IS5 family transposase [Sphingobium sp. B8D3D]MCW2411862.1 IS5 family transposase [Sphingobium sp. B8D3D]MCW2411941.1 IS5 family transposase [Sphingobium sp. B8D3D]